MKTWNRGWTKLMVPVLLALTVLLPRTEAATVYPLGNEARATLGATHLVVVTYADFDTAATNTAETVEIFSVQAKMGVECVAMILKTPFKDSTDAGHNSTSVTVGDGGSANRFVTATELNENGTEIYLKYGTGTSLAYTTADTVDIVATPNVEDATGALDTGEVWIYLKVVDARFDAR